MIYDYNEGKNLAIFIVLYWLHLAPPKQSKLLSVCGYFVGDWGEVELGALYQVTSRAVQL